MAPLREKYLAQIRKWDWDGIVADAKNNIQEGGFDTDERYGSLFLGSVLSIMPSGKYYMPWANSNVAGCSQCGGTGRTKKVYRCKQCEGKGWRSVGSFMYGEETFEACRQRLIECGLDPIPETFDLFKCNVCDGTRKISHSCNRCGGLGSYEAYQDQEFSEALDHVAEEHGGWVESGEGDPLDMFFCISVEQAEEEEVEDA